MSVILSKHGSVRGLEGGVGKAVDSFREKTKRLNVSSVLQRIQEDEMPDDNDGRMGKVVLYVTSVQAVRETHELCKQVVHILKSRRVVFTQKDVFLHPDYGRELSERMEREEEDERIALPQCTMYTHIASSQAPDRI